MAPPECSWAVIQIALVVRGLRGVDLAVCRRRPWRATDEGGGKEVVVDEEQRPSSVLVARNYHTAIKAG